MYVYLAVDCYTYDLLHLEIYPFNDKHSAKAFLLALRAKGYHPRVVVTDMRVDYGPLIARVFPKAVHHECIFHALQQLGEHIKEVYGADYAETYPEVETLKEEINHIFDARTKRTAHRRYEAVLAQREHFVTHTPDAAAVFDFLERHWPKPVLSLPKGWSTPLRASTSPLPTTPPSRSSSSLPSTVLDWTVQGTTRPSAASSLSKVPGFTWPSSRKSIVSLPSPMMPKSASGASAHWNWPVMRCRSCQWLNSFGVWPSSAPPQPSRSLSPMCDAHRLPVDIVAVDVI